MIVDHRTQPTEQWREGVTTKMLVAARNGATALCLFEQHCTPGSGAPRHTHTVEEVLTICEGTAELWLDDTTSSLTAGQSAIIAPGKPHGFRNVGQDILHVRAILAAPFFEATSDTGATRRLWMGSR